MLQKVSLKCTRRRVESQNDPGEAYGLMIDVYTFYIKNFKEVPKE